MNAAQCTIEDIDGKIYIRDVWQNEWKYPIKYRLAWPTGLNTKDYPHLVGESVTMLGTGLVKIDKTGQYIALEHREKTYPDNNHIEERRIPKSPGCHEYKNGHWRV